MAVPPEAIEIALIAATAVMALLYYYLCRKSGTSFFTYGLIGSAAIAVSAIAYCLPVTLPAAHAVADMGILAAGFAALASSRWLLFAFRITGEPDDR